jgi:hypothetical protein
MGYKSTELIREAHSHGYSFLTPAYFKKLVQRGVFPHGQRIRKPSGQVSRDSEWGDRDRVRLLDMCFLHGLNARSDAVKLGLWLLGHDVEDVRPLLVEQLERIQVLLMGRPLKPGESLGEEAVDAALAHVDSVLEQSSVLADVSYDLDHGVHDLDIDDAIDLHPDRCNGTSRATLRAFARPARSGHWRELQLRIGGEEYVWTEYEYAYPNPGIHPKQLNHLQHTAISKHLSAMLNLDNQPCEDQEAPAEAGYNLPALTHALAGVTTQHLEDARWLMVAQTGDLLHEYSAIPYHVRDKRLDLRRLLEPYKGNPRYLIASPKLFPFTTLMIAAHVFEQQTMRPVAASADVTVRRPGVPLSFNMGLLALALDRLLKCQGALHDTRDALLTLIFAIRPEPDEMRDRALV